MNLAKSLKWWERYGEYVLMVTAYQDAVIAEANDCTFKDADGNEYLDMCSGQVCALVGHNHPELVRRVSQQMERLVHTGTSFLSPVVFEASAKIAEIAPGDLSKSILLSTGAEANEYALRLAKTYTGKTGVLSLTKGYAGLTLATTSLSNYGKSAYPVVPGSGYLLTPDPTECPPDQSPIDYARELLYESLELNRGLLNNVAAIIVEPILSAGGLIVLPDGYLRELRAVADDLDALLISDEAQTGMGRTGRWFGVQHDGVVPDILVLSKGAGGGFPFSAVVTTPAIADKVIGRANQYSSHQSDPLGAAAALALIEIIEAKDLMRNAVEMGNYMIGRLEKLAENRPQLAHVRGRGLMVGFDVFRDPGKRTPNSDDGRAVEDYCLAQGLHLQCIQQNRFRILPPLTIRQNDIDRFIAVLDAALAALASGEAKPHQAENPYTAAVQARKSGVLWKTLQWAWTHSPKTWSEKLRASLK